MKEQAKRYLLFVLTVTIAVYLGGCTNKFRNFSPSDNFLQSKNASIGLIWTSNANLHYPEGSEYTAKYYMLGDQRLLDRAVARFFSGKLVTVLGEIKLKDLMREHYFNVFQPAFENKNFIVKINTEPYCRNILNFIPYCSKNEYCTNILDVKNLEAMKISDSIFEVPFIDTRYDYKSVISSLGVDYLLVIDLISHGIGRSYSGTLAISPPKGYTMLVSHLIDGKTEHVISQHVSSVVEPVEGEWDEPPKYINLMNASEASFEIAINEVFIDIFKQAP